MAILLKFIYRFNAIPTKPPAGFFTEIDNLKKFKWKFKEPRIIKTILKKNKFKGLISLDLKSYHKVRVMKTHGGMV